MSRPDREAPPRLAAWLVARVVAPAAREGVLGDLLERYRTRAGSDGLGPARRWYWRQAAAFLLRVPLARACAAYGETTPTTGGGTTQDVLLAVRTLRRRPALTITATAVLALAVGANTTVFSVVNAILIQRLPFPDPERLVMLWDEYPQGMGRTSPIALAHYRAWAQRTDLFSEIGAWESTSPALVNGEWPERIDGALVTSSLLPLLGARPALGRLFVPDDEAPGAEPVVVLSHDLWEARFGADPAIVDGTIELDGKRTRVIGIASPGLWFYDPYSATRSLTTSGAAVAKLWQPLPTDAFGGETDYPRYRVIARLQDGVTAEGAAEAAGAMRRRLSPTSAGDDGELVLLPLSEQVAAEARPHLLGLFGAVSLVLVIACVNLVSLLLVQLESRRSDFAVRVALGAGRRRVVRQLVAETMLLGLMGGLVGLLVSGAATAGLLGLVPRGLPLANRVTLDATVAAFGTGLAVLAGLAIGMAAALRIDPRRLAASVAAGGRTTAGARASRRLHGTFITAEVALSLVLLISATLLLRSLVSARRVETGFDAGAVLTFEAMLAPGREPGTGESFFERLEARVSEIPGVAAVGATSALPFSRWVQAARVEVDPAPSGEPPEGSRRRADYRMVSPGYFDAIGLPVRAGRVFDREDREGSPALAVVNEAFVAEWLGGDAHPIGRTVTITWRRQTPSTIVGVVANVKHGRLFEDDRPIVYAPALQTEVYVQRFAVRSTGADPYGLVEPIRRVAAEIDSGQPLNDFVSFEELVGQSIEVERFFAKVIAAFAATAVLLTLIGLYGVVSYATRQRDREIGIRMALGAGRGQVQGLVLGQGLVPVARGIGLGCLAALSATGLLEGLLHGVPRHDAASYGLATVAFAVTAAAACVIPARRAARLDAVRVLRSD